MIRRLFAALALVLAPIAALAGDGNDASLQQGTLASQVAAAQAAATALSNCLTYNPSARDASGNVPLPRGPGVVCPTPTVQAQIAALTAAKAAAAAANTALATDLTGLGLTDASAQQVIIAAQTTTGWQAVIDALTACIAYDPAARDASGRVPLPRGKPVVCPKSTTQAKLVALTTANTAASTAVAALAADLTAAGFPTGGSLGPSGIPVANDITANWTKAGLATVGGIPTRSTVCATVNPLGGGASDTLNIQNAINACPSGQVVALSAGTFTIPAAEYILVSKDVTLRGAGAGSTILTRSDGAVVGVNTTGNGANPIIQMASSRYNINHSTGTLLTADAAQGAYSVQVTDPTGFAVGQMVLLDEASGASWQTDPEGNGQVWASADFRVVYDKHNPKISQDNYDATAFPSDPGTAGCWYSDCDRVQNELKQVASISGNTITFDSPIMISYRASTPHFAKLAYWTSSQTVKNAGVESLTTEYSTQGGVVFYACMYCWAKNVEIRYWIQGGINFLYTFRDQVEGTYIHEGTWPVPGGNGYSIDLQFSTSEILIENSISVLANKVSAGRAAGAGSVFAYNYMDDGFIWGTERWQETGINGSHNVGSHHTLFEGNYTFNLDSDHTHGNSTYHTYFRNYASGFRRAFTTYVSPPIFVDDEHNQPGSNTPLRAAGLMGTTYWMVFEGNVLGKSGSMSGWAYSSSGTSWGPAIYVLGWDDHTPYTQDTNVPATTTIDGNYDYLQNAQTWDNTLNPSHLLPNSRFTATAPAFFSGACTWPPVNPGGTTKVGILPAKARYDAGTPNTIGAGC